MSTMNQTIVEPAVRSVDVGEPLVKGKRNDTDLFASFPGSPLPGYAHTGDGPLHTETDNDGVKTLFNTAVRFAAPVGLDGYYGVDFTRDFTGVAPGVLVPNVPALDIAAIGIPTPYTPNTTSPGQDWSGPATTVSSETQPSNPMPGAGGGNLLSPSVSSDSMAVTGAGAGTLGDYALGQSPASLPAEPIETA